MLFQGKVFSGKLSQDLGSGVSGGHVSSWVVWNLFQQLIEIVPGIRNVAHRHTNAALDNS